MYLTRLSAKARCSFIFTAGEPTPSIKDLSRFPKSKIKSFVFVQKQSLV